AAESTVVSLQGGHDAQDSASRLFHCDRGPRQRNFTERRPQCRGNPRRQLDRSHHKHRWQSSHGFSVLSPLLWTLDVSVPRLRLGSGGLATAHPWPKRNEELRAHGAHRRDGLLRRGDRRGFAWSTKRLLKRGKRRSAKRVCREPDRDRQSRERERRQLRRPGL